jgi:hypothetical protein
LGDLYIDIPRWDEFQHYKNVDRPAWLKLYTKLLNNHAYTDLSLHQRGLLHGIWMEYAMSNRQLRGDTLTLTRRLGHRVSTRDIESLVHAGFITLCSRDAIEQIRVEKKEIRTRVVGSELRGLGGADEQHGDFNILPLLKEMP